MSGTAFGTIVLHVSPDAASGGPLALIESGDRVRLSVNEQRIDLLVDPDTLKRRQRASPATKPTRGYAWLYDNFITQADKGCDFGFMRRQGP
jgi:dihydroxy-acid dehydratase